VTGEHKPTLQDRKQDLVRNIIWDAAIDRFAEKGFEQTTIEEIAEAAGVSRRSFFRYFSSKDDLMSHGIAEYGASLCEVIRSCPDYYTPLQVVRQTALCAAERAAAAPRARKVLEIAASHPGARQAQLSSLADIELGMTEAFALRRGRRSREAPLPRLLASLTLSLLDVTMGVWFEQAGQQIGAAFDLVFSTMAGLFDGRLHSPAVEKKKRVS